jgi:membrane dipeptidase
VPLAAMTSSTVVGTEPSLVTKRARRVHAAGLLFDGHNDLPWRLRTEGDVTFDRLDIGRRLDGGNTDIPRLRAGGVKAQF